MPENGAVEIGQIRRCTSIIGSPALMSEAPGKLYEVIRVSTSRTHVGQFFEPVGGSEGSGAGTHERPCWSLRHRDSELVEWSTEWTRASDAGWREKLPKAGDKVLVRIDDEAAVAIVERCDRSDSHETIRTEGDVLGQIWHTDYIPHEPGVKVAEAGVGEIRRVVDLRGATFDGPGKLFEVVKAGNLLGDLGRFFEPLGGRGLTNEGPAVIPGRPLWWVKESDLVEWSTRESRWADPDWVSKLPEVGSKILARNGDDSVAYLAEVGRLDRNSSTLPVRVVAAPDGDCWPYEFVPYDYTTTLTEVAEEGAPAPEPVNEPITDLADACSPGNVIRFTAAGKITGETLVVGCKAGPTSALLLLDAVKSVRKVDGGPADEQWVHIEVEAEVVARAGMLPRLVLGNGMEISLAEATEKARYAMNPVLVSRAPEKQVVRLSFGTYTIIDGVEYSMLIVTSVGVLAAKSNGHGERLVYSDGGLSYRADEELGEMTIRAAAGGEFVGGEGSIAFELPAGTKLTVTS